MSKFFYLFISLTILHATIFSEENEQEVLQKAQESIRLIDKYKNSAENERQKILNQLKENKEFVLSYIESKIIQSGCREEIQIMKILWDSDKKDNNDTLSIEKLNELIAQLKSASPNEKYFAEKMLFATKLYHLGDYDKALNIVNSILYLENRLSFTNELRLLRIKIEDKILAQTVVLPVIRTEKEIFEIGDRVKIFFEIHNLTKEAVDLIFFPDDEKNSQKDAVKNCDLNITLLYTEFDPYGNTFSLQRQEVISITENKKINSSEIWQKEIEIDTALDNPKKPIFRAYTINAEIRPFEIRTPEKSYIRKIVFPYREIKVFPPDIKPVLKEPLKFFSKALDGGNANDIFLCSLLLPDDFKKIAVEMLIKALPNARDSGKKVIMNCLRHITKEKIVFDENEWYKYWEKVSAEQGSGK